MSDLVLKEAKGPRDRTRSERRPAAIILADALVGDELLEIFGEVEAASLMIAGRTVIEHILLELQDVGLDQCIVLAGKNANSIQEMVGNDGRWGMTVNVMTYSRSKAQVLKEFKSLSEASGLLVIEANKVRSHCIEKFWNQAICSDYSLLEAHDHLGPVGMTLLKPTQADFIINAMPIVLNSILVNSLETARDFHRANFDLMTGDFDGLEPSVVINNQYGRRQHWSSHVAKGVSGNWLDVMIDKHCQVGRKATLNSVILNHNVYVEDRAYLDNSVVMANSVITASKPIVDSIIFNDTVFELSGLN